ncbi:MAG TPA: hypothetical protein VMU24_05740 [Candidatus Acidoferrales bacterium]|nr:hypothetical protein [Candidatus Acidoferrales bacterium]
MSFRHHFRRPVERPFKPEERESVTILLGGLTWKHERLIQAVLQRSGHKCESLAQPDRDAHEVGKEYCNNGLCNPAYFTIGNLIKRLRKLEEDGLSREEIVRDYIFFTAGSAGPCRYGMYEAEFRSALHAAGYPGFRVVLFLQDHGIKASSGQSGLHFSVDFGMCALHAFILGDLINDLHRKLRAYEAVRGEADRVIANLVSSLSEYFLTGPFFDLEEFAPKLFRSVLRRYRSSGLFRFVNTYCKVADHLYGSGLTGTLKRLQESLSAMEVDRLQVKPMVKVIGEFWAQLTEGDGNFRVFEFLENEGAEVGVEPISTWIVYLLHQSRQKLAEQRKLAIREDGWRHPFRAATRALACSGKSMLYALGGHIYRSHYQRLAKALGGFTPPLTSQEELAALAKPHYHSMLRGGEGHLEVGKNLYYFKHRKTHMVLSMKPFGCLPSMQSDAVQASLVSNNPEMVFLSVETAGEGEIHAHSRVQMALADAKTEARRECASVLASTHHSEAEIRQYILRHRELRSATYPVVRRPGITSTAANFMLQIDSLLDDSSNQRTPRILDERSRRRVSMSPTPSHQESQNV